MSNISERQIALFKQIFTDNRGFFECDNMSKPTVCDYVLNCSGIDIADSEQYVEIPSVIKKLVHFMRIESNGIVGIVMSGLIERKTVEVERLSAESTPYPYLQQLDELRSYFHSIQNVAHIHDVDIEDSGTQVLNSLIRAGIRLSCNSTYRASSLENSINDYMRDMLTLQGHYIVQDQTRHGLSEARTDAGEVDILLLSNDREVAIVEGLRLSCVNSAAVDSHLRKILIEYNPGGTNAFLVIYYAGEELPEFWRRLLIHMDTYQYPIDTIESLQNIAIQNAAIRVARARLSKDDHYFLLFIVTIKLLD